MEKYSSRNSGFILYILMYKRFGHYSVKKKKKNFFRNFEKLYIEKKKMKRISMSFFYSYSSKNSGNL